MADGGVAARIRRAGTGAVRTRHRYVVQKVSRSGRPGGPDSAARPAARRPRPRPAGHRRPVRRPHPRPLAHPRPPHPADTALRSGRPSPGRRPARFETLIAREDVTRLKPAPDAYHLAAHALGRAPSRCLAFENTDDGLTSALTAGIPVIDVRHATWTPQRP
ncbi:HAD family hydrolase [Streptomyces sp. NPDC054854]